MEALRDRWRRSLTGRAWLEIRRDGRVVRRTAIESNAITNLGLAFVFWGLWQSTYLNYGAAPSAPLAGLSYSGDNGTVMVPNVGNLIYYDGTYYLPAWSNPLAFLYASTDSTAPSASTNVLPGGTLIALGSVVGYVQGTVVKWSPPGGQSVSGSGAWALSAITGTTPSLGLQSTTSTLVTVPFAPYAGSGTITVGSVGFTNGLYAATSSTTSWTAINGAEMSLTGSTTPASTANLAIGSKLLPSTTLSVTNGEQLVVNYEISFTPA